MNGDVMRGALWANDLTRLRHPGATHGPYALVQVRSIWLLPKLAAAMAVDELVVRERLERGCRAFAAWSWPDNAPASWLWVSTGEEYAPAVRRTLRIPEGDCYGWEAGTIELHRARGLAAWLLEWAGWRMAESGMSTMWNGIDDANVPSRRAHARAGFQPVLRVVANHESPPSRLRTWATDYADERLVERARQLLGSRAGVVAGAEGGVSLQPIAGCQDQITGAQSGRRPAAVRRLRSSVGRTRSRC